MVASAGKGYAFQRRPDTGGLSVHTTGGAGTPPGWVRIVRAGDLLQAYRSADGATWTLVGMTPGFAHAWVLAMDATRARTSPSPDIG